MSGELMRNLRAFPIIALALASAPAGAEQPSIEDFSCLLGEWRGVDENGEISEERFWRQDDRIIRFLSLSQPDGTLEFLGAMHFYSTEEGVFTQAIDFPSDMFGPTAYTMRLTDWSEGRWEFRDAPDEMTETYVCIGPNTLQITYAQGEKSFLTEDEPVTYRMERVRED